VPAPTLGSLNSRLPYSRADRVVRVRAGMTTDPARASARSLRATLRLSILGVVRPLMATSTIGGHGA